jgi:hypothetical protein
MERGGGGNGALTDSSLAGDEHEATIEHVVEIREGFLGPRMLGLRPTADG